MLKQVIDLYEVMDDPNVTAGDIAELFLTQCPRLDYQIDEVETAEGKTEFIRITIPGARGKRRGGNAPTLGITGTLGGIGARPAATGFVSDGDGALAALSAGLKLLIMNCRGDVLDSDVIVTTHICPNAPTVPHEPVPFMGAAVSDEEINRYCVLEEMDAILSVDTTKGNEVINHNGFAISNTVKCGYLLSVSEGLTDIMKRTTGQPPRVFPLAQQDITPYGNGLNHLNSILQPAVATEAPVVGVAITAEVPVAGCATGATRLQDVESAARFMAEAAKEFSRDENLFYNREEYERLVSQYGTMSHFRTPGVREKKKIGIVVMGQADFSEKYSDVEDLIAPEAEAVIVGLMDGLTAEEVEAKYGPGRDEGFVVSTIQGGRVVKIAERHAQRLLQEKVLMLEKQGVYNNMVFCTASFQEFERAGCLVQPALIIDSLFSALKVRRIGIILPEKEQIEESYEQYKQYDPIIRAASPYGGRQAILEAARKFRTENVDLILTDCMGFTKEVGALISQESGKSVISPRVLVPYLMKAMV